jgi:ADP-heptose:LPS heptosyltransferase
MPTVPVHPHELQLTKADVGESSINTVKNKIEQLYPEWNNEAVVLLNVNASDLLPQRRWPQENFAVVGKNLLNRFQNIIIVMTGAPAEKEYVQKVTDMIGHKRCVNSSGFFFV